MIEITEAQTFAIGLGAGLMASIKIWWGRKTMQQKKAAFNDVLDACADKRISVEEVKYLVEEHF